MNKDDSYEWCSRYVEEVIEENYLVDHLKQEFRPSNKTWKYPTKSDENVVERKQPLIFNKLEVSVKGELFLTDLRNREICVRKHRDLFCI